MLIGCSVAVVACQCDPALEPIDGGDADAGVFDAGAVDAGTPDAGEADAGVMDAGETDAGARDAGLVDAGPTDAGKTDAGRPPDSGFPRSDGGLLFDTMAELPNLPLPMTLGPDFNNDRHRDGFLVQSNGANSATVVVAVATGPGSYAVTFDAGFTSANVSVLDVNTDGILDLVVKDMPQAGWTSLYRGDGFGHFAFNGKWYNVTSLLDVTGDGVPESVQIVPEGFSPGAVYVSQTFPDGGVDVGFVTNVLGTGWGLIADFNSDHIPDYVSVGDYLASTRQLRVFMGQTDGGIVASQPAVTCNNCYRGLVTLGDMNGDGRPDVVVLTGTEVKVWTVGANGALTAGPSTSRSGDRILTAYVVDMNADGRADIVAQEEGGSTQGGIRIYFARDGGLQASDDYLQTEQGSVRGVSDVDYDGLPDVLLMDNFYAQGRNGAEVLRLPARSFSLVSPDPWGWFDMNGDGLRDGVSWLQFQDKMSISLMGPRRRFAAPMECPVAPRGINERRFMRDLDGDGFADQYSFTATGLEVSRGQGMCAFDARQTWLQAPPYYGTWVDVNGDKRLDLAHDDGTVRMQLDAGVFAAPASSGLPAQSTFFAMDWSGDGRSDVILLNDAKTLITFAQSNGNGTFTLGASTGLPAGEVMDFARVDADGDGDFDVVAAVTDGFTNGSRVDLWRQTAPGVFVVQQSYLSQVCSYWTNLFVADLDLDGTPEVVVSCQVQTQVWSVGATPRWRQKLMFFSTGAVFDADGDGDADLISSPGVAMNLTR